LTNVHLSLRKLESFLQFLRKTYCAFFKILHSKISCDGFTPSGLLSPSSEDQARLLREVYNECGITPDQLSFFEAHASATKVGDLKEVQVIDEFLGKLRQKPLLIGSVKSNVGHTEAASCMCSIMKAVLAIESNVVAANLHFRKAKKGMAGIEEGRLVPVTKKTLLEGDDIVIGINNFGFGGSNGHLILKRLVSKKSEESKVMDDVPRLVCVSGRTEEAIITTLERLNERQVNVEHVGLIHQVFKKNFSGHRHRGFTIISKNQHLQTSPYLPSIQPPPFYIKFGKFDLSYKSVRMYFLNFPPFATTMEK
jgi:fatty acid synthase